MMNYYSSQDMISYKFGIGLSHMYDLPFYRYQIMLGNYNRITDEENKKSSSQNAGNSSLPNMGQLMKQSKQGLPKLSLPKTK